MATESSISENTLTTIQSENRTALFGTAAFWEQRWQEGKIGFHSPNVQTFLLKYVDLLTNGKTGLRIFVPLCGKTVDMKWLADMGHHVIGVDICRMALKQFFEENNLEYTMSTVKGLENGELYQSSDGRIQLYKCDIFDISRDMVGQFDGIWDRGAMTSILPTARARYCDIMVTVLKPTGRYLLVCVEYDKSKSSGPPVCLLESEIKDVYGSFLKIEKIAERNRMEEKWLKRGHTYFKECVYLLTFRE
ncbi:putative thiopurine S-methyltransferase [Saccoglossus kowalevskii]|uniref:thiopurine S-methyltransferase n=1 Tax=Saccoglossus kowalevskii TaxID=10224 RepID=A0ABM0GSQ3_SACKO|nr:PREDICTED: thiopurine S-methyltransferase-like [Saccoglossus kowalevskii]